MEAQYAVSAALGKDQTAYHVLPPTEAIPPGESANYQAANPNQHFDAHFDAQGACAVSDGTRWDLSVRAWGYGDTGLDGVEYRQSTINHEPSTIPLVSDNRVEYRRGALTEWYVNGPLGLQQGFTVQAPPECRGLGGGPLTFVLNLPAGGDQTQIDADRTGLTLLTDKNEPVLRYSGLTALDADGVRLPAWLETRENDHAQRVVKLLVRVEDRGARYPITIDPFIQQAKLTAADGAASDLFGISVALSDDGNTAIAGAYGADKDGNNNQGAAYVFTRSGTNWSQQAKLTAADGAASDHFGVSVALSINGNTAIAGAYGANADRGAAYVFTRSGTNWSEQAKLIAADGAAGNYFGYSVALSSRGTTAIAGAQLADVGGNANQGAAYVFTLSGTAWSEQAKLIAADGAVNDLFGISVALSSDGGTAVAGADYADVGGNANQGAAYVFTRSGTAWSQETKLTAADGAAGDYFGYSVALSGDGDTASAGAYMADMGGNADQGTAYVFTRSGVAWSQQAKLTATDGAMSDLFGVSVALSSNGNTVIVGANGTDVGGNVNQGAAYMFAALLPPTGVAASYDFYIDRVQVTWDAAAAATGYEVWRGESNDTSQATNIGTGISGTNYDDMTAIINTLGYYYWVKTTNASGASAFSASAIGRVLLGPDVRLNGAAGPVTIAVGSQLMVTVSINPIPMYLYIPADWWVLYYSDFYGIYYLNSGLTWSWDSTGYGIQPVYQGVVFGLQSAVVLDTTFLPTGTHTFYFGIDILNGFLDSFVIYDSATVTVTP